MIKEYNVRITAHALHLLHSHRKHPWTFLLRGRDGEPVELPVDEFDHRRMQMIADVVWDVLPFMNACIYGNVDDPMSNTQLSQADDALYGKYGCVGDAPAREATLITYGNTTSQVVVSFKHYGDAIKLILFDTNFPVTIELVPVGTHSFTYNDKEEK